MANGWNPWEYGLGSPIPPDLPADELEAMAMEQARPGADVGGANGEEVVPGIQYGQEAKDAALKQALLAGGLSLMGSMQPTRLPQSLAGNIGRAGIAGLGQYNKTLEDARQRDLARRKQRLAGDLSKAKTKYWEASATAKEGKGTGGLKEYSKVYNQAVKNAMAMIKTNQPDVIAQAIGALKQKGNAKPSDKQVYDEIGKSFMSREQMEIYENAIKEHMHRAGHGKSYDVYSRDRTFLMEPEDEGSTETIDEVVDLSTLTPQQLSNYNILRRNPKNRNISDKRLMEAVKKGR